MNGQKGRTDQVGDDGSDWRSTPVIFHLTFAADWDASRTAGEYRLSTRGRTLEEVGFMHCGFEDQVDRVASALFAGTSGLVLLTIDPALVHAEIRHENLDGCDELFPHIYGPLNLDAVVAVKRCEPPPSQRARPPSKSGAASVRARAISARSASVSWSEAAAATRPPARGCAPPRSLPSHRAAPVSRQLQPHRSAHLSAERWESARPAGPGCDRAGALGSPRCSAASRHAWPRGVPPTCVR
jgi:uncharacterized protein (DUF952 family)